MKHTNVTITKADGTHEVFDRTMLEMSLVKAGATKDVAGDIAAHIQGELSEGMSTTQIYTHAFFLLRKLII